MYHYNSRSRFGRSKMSLLKKTKNKRLVQYGLIAAAVVLAIIVVARLAGVGGLDEANYESQRNSKIRSEMQHALTQTNSLSRLGAKSASTGLGRIRQYVHGVEVLNELNVGLYGEVGRMYEQSDFDDIYDIIDVYDARLSSGSKINESQALLVEAINKLNEKTNRVLISR